MQFEIYLYIESKKPEERDTNQMKNKKYHTVGNPVPKKLPHCRKSSSKILSKNRRKWQTFMKFDKKEKNIDEWLILLKNTILLMNSQLVTSYTL
jgi:hypothetical protein